MGSWTRRPALRSADHHLDRQAWCIVWGLDTLGTLSLLACRGLLFLGVGGCVTRLGVCGV